MEARDIANIVEAHIKVNVGVGVGVGADREALMYSNVMYCTLHSRVQSRPL